MPSSLFASPPKRASSQACDLISAHNGCRALGFLRSCELITEAVNGKEQRLEFGFLFYLGADATNGHVGGALVSIKSNPETRSNNVCRESATPGLLASVSKSANSRGFNLTSMPSTRASRADFIDFQTSELQRLRRIIARDTGAAQNGLDARDQLAEAKRSADVPLLKVVGLR
jgi:hypothetical protein